MENPRPSLLQTITEVSSLESFRKGLDRIQLLLLTRPPAYALYLAEDSLASRLLKGNLLPINVSAAPAVMSQMGLWQRSSEGAV